MRQPALRRFSAAVVYADTTTPIPFGHHPCEGDVPEHEAHRRGALGARCARGPPGPGVLGRRPGAGTQGECAAPAARTYSRFAPLPRRRSPTCPNEDTRPRVDEGTVAVPGDDEQG